MNIVFFGTPEFAVPSLRALLASGHRVVGVVCQPDRPAGRGQRLQPPPVKVLAESAGVPVLQPTKVRSDEFLAALRDWAPDLIVVVAYGRILPNSILELPRLGCINVHASLLPRLRGAAPIQWAIRRGDRTTGVTLMHISEQMDAGDILLRAETPIGDAETYGELQARLAELGGEVLGGALADLEAGRLVRQPQDESQVTYAPLITKEDGRIDWSLPAHEIALAARAFHPWPTAYTSFDGKRLQVHRASSAAGASTTAPGTVLEVGDSIAVATGDGMLRIHELQLEGRKRMAAADFVRGGLLHKGDLLG